MVYPRMGLARACRCICGWSRLWERVFSRFLDPNLWTRRYIEASGGRTMEACYSGRTTARFGSIIGLIQGSTDLTDPLLTPDYCKSSSEVFVGLARYFLGTFVD